MNEKRDVYALVFQKATGRYQQGDVLSRHHSYNAAIKAANNSYNSFLMIQKYTVEQKMNKTLSAARQLKNLIGQDNWRSALEQIMQGNEDFYSDDDCWRIIKADCAMDVLVSELESDEYLLGSFNSWFLADVTNLPESVFQILQKSEAYEAIGELIISLGKVDELAQEYVRHDGSGHHFSHYDGNEHSFCWYGFHEYRIFRVN